MGGKGSGRRPGGPGVPKEKNPLLQAKDPACVDRDANSRSIALARDVYSMPPVDLKDAEAVEARIFEYLDLCDAHGVKPLVTGLANSLGIGRQELYRIGQGDERCMVTKLTDKSRLAVKKAYELFEQIWEGNLAQEKGNPVKWIFLGKNHFGYRDQKEQTIVHREEQATLPSPEEAAAKYAALVGREQPTLGEAEIVDVEDA